MEAPLPSAARPRTGAGTARTTRARSGSGTRPSDDDDPRWRCATCNTWQASRSDELTVDGTTRHLRLNPAGLVCRFITLRRCREVIPLTAATADYTWFPPYPWRVLACARCGTHLGWDYTDAEGQPAFCAVLLDRVREP